MTGGSFKPTQTCITLKMNTPIFLGLYFFILASACSPVNSQQQHVGDNNVTALHMRLSNYGVETLSFPAFTVTIDFVNGRSLCQRTNDNPSTTDSTYTLSKSEIDSIKKLLDSCDLKHLKTEYKASATDQPTSYDTLYMGNNIIFIKDYGMIADTPMQSIYSIVYKFGR